MRRDPLIAAAALSAALAIGCGAFAAHGAGEQAAGWLHTGSLYQLVHAVAALAIRDRRAGWTMLAGATLFAATLYLMALGLPRWLGAITPIGGVAMIAGWLMLAWRAIVVGLR